MSLFKRVVRTGRGQKGFTMVEVMLATFIMAFTSVGLIGMFNSSTQLSNVARERKDAQRYAETISETITAIPFYQPYDGSHDIDVDDHFWGSATDRGGSITTNNWSTAPYVTYNPPSNIADSRYTAAVKMVYVLGDLSTKNMKSDWVPKDTTSAGLDKPSSVDAVVYHLIKFEVKVSWKSTLAEGSTTRSETYVTLMSDTQYEANLGVSAITNVDPSRPGSSGANSGPHTASALMIQISGHGFVTGQTITASLVMQG
ncbi:MAG TPA: prepilin-type N-terminal cleavage/methylation domain-containing protein, partial [Candidatus Anoxymicrobiaceae bacterium]